MRTGRIDQLPRGHRAKLGGVKLDGANLTDANLNKTDLKTASLVGATAENAMFYGSDMSAANLSGADLVFFDGEEGPVSLGAGDPQWQALGSPYFAEHLADFYPQAKPAAAAIFDMVCYRNIRLLAEESSVAYARSDVEKFWSIGNELAPKVFVPQVTSTPIFDDQNALADAGIPSFLVIGFQYDPWFNTAQDTIDKCSIQTLETIGRTTVRYLYLPR